MFARYASAVTTGSFVTFGLLFVMQLLISLQPGAKTDPKPTIPVNWIKLQVDDSPVVPKNTVIEKEKLTNTELPPPRMAQASGQDPIYVALGDPPPPTATGLPVMGVFTDGPLVSLVRVAPIYPARAISNGTEGYVVLQFDVTADGRVINIVIIESTDRVFDRAAIHAAERFKFKPRVVDGVAYASYGLQNMFTFTLDDQ